MEQVNQLSEIEQELITILLKDADCETKIEELLYIFRDNIEDIKIIGDNISTNLMSNIISSQNKIILATNCTDIYKNINNIGQILLSKDLTDEEKIKHLEELLL